VPGLLDDVEPLPETTEAVDEFGPFDEGDLLAKLRRRGDRVQRLVPSCIGLSLASHRAGVTFTLVATAEEIALLDGVQYLGGGPCVAAVESDRVLDYGQHDLFDEAGWHLFARATATQNVASTLTLPVLVDERVGGSINLYASAPYAFVGLHEQIARIFDAWAPGAVVNADLPFSTRHLAQEAPQHLHREYVVAVAAGILAETSRLTPEDGGAELTRAAARAGVSEAALAEMIIALHRTFDRE